MRIEAPVLRKAREPMIMTELDVDDPRPGEVRVRMVATGVCHSCLNVADGSASAAPMPIVLGDEGAGIVDALGEGVQGLEIGDHVVISWAMNCGTCPACMAGRPVLCTSRAPIGKLRDGTCRFHVHGSGEDVYHYGPATYAPQIIVPATSAIRVRRDLPFDKAALLGCSVTTGMGAVLNTAEVRTGQSVAVYGCGGVGLNAIQAAKLAGAYPVIAVDVNPRALDLAKRLGASHVVDSSGGSAEPGVRTVIPAGVDAAVVCVGNTRVMEDALRAVARGGTLVLVGFPPSGATMNLDPRLLMGAERRVLGSLYGSFNPAIAFPMLADMYMSGRLDLDTMVTSSYGLEQSNEAFADMAGGALGRGVIMF